jgi:hypothetical protein
VKYNIQTEDQRATALADLEAIKLPARMELHESGKRTLTQNAALHLWLQWLADALNEAGYDMRRTLKPEAEIPWTAAAAKEHLWRPIQEAMTSKESTAEVSRTDYADVQEVLVRHLANKLGVQAPPWPKREAAA